MHRIVASHLNNFSLSHGLTSLEESDKFERFSNYCVLRSRTSLDFDLDDVTTGSGDDGIDGVAILINEEVILSREDCAAIFEKGRKNNDVEVVCVQSKTGEGFDLGEFLKFRDSILRFVNESTYSCEDEIQVRNREIFDVVISNVPKIRDGKPVLTARFVTTGLYRDPFALERARAEAVTTIQDLGLFASVDIRFVDRDELTKLWVSTYSGSDATIDLFSIAPLPPIAGIEEAYLGVVRAKELVSKLLSNADGTIRAQVFEENVRSFLGADNLVNSAIAETLTSSEVATRFPVLNNGITIVSPDVRVQGSSLHLKDYQIVNGCQTSHVLWENFRALDESVMVHVKVVETTNEDIFAELVRATNSQTKVDDKQFFSLRPIIKRVEKYFDSYSNDAEGRLYLERRDRQFSGQDVAALRVYSVHNAVRAVCSMHLMRPDLASRYPKQMYEEFGETLFSEKTKEIVFYSAALALYRFHLLVSNGAIAQNTKRYKWHILPLIKMAITGDARAMPLESNQLERQCEKIVKALIHHSDEATHVVQRAVNAVAKLEPVTRDRLKGQSVLQEMLANL